MVTADRSRSFWQWWGDRDEWLLAAMTILPVSLIGSGLLLLLGPAMAIANRGWQRDRRFHRSLAIVAAALIAVTAAAGNGESWLGLANYLPFLLAMVLVAQVLRSRWRVRRFLVALVAGSWGIALLGLGQAIWGWSFRWVLLGSLVHVKLVGEYSGRPTSVFSNPNALAVYLVMVVAIAAGLWCDRRERPEREWGRRAERIVVAGGIGLGLPLLIATESRNGWLVALLVSTVALGILRRWLWLGLLLGAIAIPIGAAADVLGLRAIVPGTIWQRLAESVDPSSVGFESMVTRWRGWQLAVQMWREQPLVGWGWQSFGDRWAAQVPPPEVPLFHAHNIYLSIAAEGGLVALVALGLVWGWTMVRGWLVWRAERLDELSGYLMMGVNVALLAYFLAGILDAPFFDGRLNVVVWMVLAVVLASWRDIRSDRTDLQDSGDLQSLESQT